MDDMDSGGEWAPHDSETVSMLVSLQVDIGCILEADGEAPPVFFRNRDLLLDWATCHGLQMHRIGGAKPGSAVRLGYFYSSHRRNVSFGYSQIWVRASYRAYARRLRHVALESFHIDPADWSGMDADHVINRASLAHHPDAWVALFPVKRQANRHFGAIVESRLPAIRPNVDRINLPPIAAFKLFCGLMPRTPEEFRRAMSKVRRHFDTAIPAVGAYCDDIERDARSALFEGGAVTVERTMLYIYRMRGQWGVWARFFTWVLRPNGQLTASAAMTANVYETLDEARAEIAAGWEAVARLTDGRFAFDKHPSLVPFGRRPANDSDEEFEIIEVWA